METREQTFNLTVQTRTEDDEVDADQIREAVEFHLGADMGFAKVLVVAEDTGPDPVCPHCFMRHTPHPRGEIAGIEFRSCPQLEPNQTGIYNPGASGRGGYGGRQRYGPAPKGG